MKVVILAGGGGTRLFPLSRSCFPKQFLKVGSEKTLLSQTIKRFLKIVKAEDIIIISNENYFHHIKNEILDANAEGCHLLLEPIGKNTCPATILGIKYCIDKLNCDLSESIIVSPSDQIIDNEDEFINKLQRGVSLSSNSLILLGIRPDKFKEDYGYIEYGEDMGDYFNVKNFIEKPPFNKVEKLLNQNKLYWNSGIFIFDIKFLNDSIKKYQPILYRYMLLSYEEFINKFSEMPNISLDYGIAEKGIEMKVIPLDCYWNDIGSWDAIYDVYDKDDKGNAVKGDCITIDCNNSLLLGRDRLIAGIGLEDVLVVETDDVIVVAKKGESQKVKDLVDELKVRNRKEASEHTTMYRPWGSYTVLGEGQGYKMKKICVSPKQRLSLQLHYHRSEHWIVTQGTAKVTIGETEMIVQENESVFVPIATKHRLENPGLIPLEIIEVQNGSYLEEDDIVRFDDEYGRQ